MGNEQQPSNGVNFEQEVEELESIVLTSNYISSQEHFKDEYRNPEQRKRDKEITRLLEAYVSSYQKKSKWSARFKIVILLGAGSFMAVVLTLCVMLVRNYTGNENSVSDTVALVTAFITALTSGIGIIKIIVEYVFPKADEEHIAQIVRLIQENDLKTMQTNIDATRTNDKSE